MATDDVYVYAPGYDAWQVLGRLPRPRAKASCGVVGGSDSGKRLVAIMGGEDADGKLPSEMDLLDPDTMEWTQGEGRVFV